MNSVNIIVLRVVNSAGRLRKTLGAKPCDRVAALPVSEMSTQI